MPREIWPQENVANPGVKVEMNFLCFAGDLGVCRVGYRARALMESRAKCLKIDLLLLQPTGSRAGAAARAVGGAQMSPWACTSTPDTKLYRGTTAKPLFPSPRQSQQIWDLFAPCTALPEGWEGNLSPWCLLSSSLSVHLAAVPKWKKALFLFTVSALSWPRLCTKA